MTDFTKGPIVRPLILFAVPVLLGIVFQRLYNVFDTMLVGRFIDKTALAAVGASGIIFNLFITICNGFSNGFGIVIGQKYGAENQDELKKAIAGAYLFAIIISIILTALGIIFINPILRLIQVPEELFPQARTYLLILTMGLVLTVMYNVFTNILRSFGDSVMPLVFLIVSVALNFGFDILFIVVLKMGVAGTAIATVIAQGISALLTILFSLTRRPVMRIKLSEFKITLNIIRELLSQGAAMSLMFTVVDIGSVVLQAGINALGGKLGSDLIAGYTAGRKYLELGMIPGGAFAVSSASFVGQNYGAKQYGRIKKGVGALILISWICATATLFISIFAGRLLITSITGKDAGDFVINTGLKYLRIGVPFYYALYVLVIIRSSLQGINQKLLPLVASGIELLVKILATAWLIPALGYIMVCIAEPIIWVLGMLWVTPAFLISLKKLNKD